MAARFAPLTEDDPTEVGGYALRARLGAGGMGRVYLSFTPGGRALAIKVIRIEHAEDEEFRRRFEQEVKAAQRVQGLYTASVVDADTTARLPWLATVYVPGPSLRQAVSDYGPLPPPTVFRLLAGVAEGLISVHASGIIHRDLTPANVLLAQDGPRVIDFGIAHAAAATSLTRTGMQVGTPAFMAPEQVRGHSATAATDVFALGNLAVFAAIGRGPFGEGNQDALFYRIRNEPPALDDCPQEIRAIAIRCLAKEPDERPAPTEVMEYAREQTQGGTIRLAGSWLPEVIATALPAYDTTAFLPPRTKPVTHVQPGPLGPPGQPPVPPPFVRVQPVSAARSFFGGIAAAVAIVAVIALIYFVGLKLLKDVPRAHPSSSVPTQSAAPVAPPVAPAPIETGPIPTTEAAGVPAGCTEAGQSIDAFDRLEISTDPSANAAYVHELAAGLRVASEQADDPTVNSALTTLATDLDTAASDLDVGDLDGYRALLPTVNNDAYAVLDACNGPG